MFWRELVHIGDVPLTLAAAAAVAMWLVMGRRWRLALLWSLLFTLGLGLVVTTKVAFIVWGSPLPGSDFKAVSGHAAGVTAVLPTLLFLLLQQWAPRLQRAGVAAGLTAGALMGVLLVEQGHHSIAEVMAGWAIGAAVSLGGIWLANSTPRPPGYALWCSTVVFAATIYTMHSFPFGYVMHRAAHALTGNSTSIPFTAPVRECKIRPKKEASCLPEKCVVQPARGWHSSERVS
ncbi:phosphatase PAP2 family protein [Massilia sp. LXY-6]|uniref:phosphatase PAP2 family protein n=1 Tax=Massilia sp. LXY-6 TaxID=3379823 RepID=UPI003EDEB4D4